MLFRQLEYFIQICQDGSFTKAAEVLLVSQPALSQQIRLLEQEFGIPLFNRVGRGVEITKAGKIVLEKGDAILQLIEEARKETAALKQNQRNTITIGISTGDLMTYMMPKFFEFYEQHPDISLKFIDMEDGAKQLLHNKIDIGISTSKPIFSDNEIASHSLFDEELVLVVPEDHPWADNTVISFRTLENLQTVFVNDIQLGKHLSELAKKAEVNLRIQIEEKSACTTSLVNMFHSKVGVTIMPRPLIESYRYPRIKFIPLIDPKPTREILLFYRKDKLMPHVAHTLIPYISNITKDL